MFIKTSKFKLHLFFPLAILMIAAALTAAYFNKHLQFDALHKQKSVIAPTFLSSFESVIEDSAQNLSGYLDLLKQNHRLQQALADSDRDRIQTIIKPIYQDLSRKIDLTHLYFIDSQGAVLLRAHEPNRHSDIIQRHTFLEAKKTLQPSYGLEFGAMNHYTLRVVHPWIVDGVTIGFVELGKEVDKYMDALSAQLGIEMYLAIDRPLYHPMVNSDGQAAETHAQTEQHVIIYETNPPPQNMQAMLTSETKQKFFWIDERVYLKYLAPLRDVAGQSLGKILLLIDVSTEYRSIQNSAQTFDIIVVLLGVLATGLAYFFLHKEQRRVSRLAHSLSIKSKKLQSANEQLKTFLAQNQELLSQYKCAVDETSIVSKTDLKGKITYVNDAFCTISGYTREELIGKPHNIVRHPNMPASAFAAMWETIRSKQSWQGIVKNRKKDGGHYIVETTVLPLLDSTGEIQEYISIRHDITETIELKNEIIETQKEIIYTLGELGESRSKETGNHVKRVAEYSKILALAYGLPEYEADLIRSASPMHDIGKIAMPDTILLKPGPLEPDEFMQMRQHTEMGYNLFKNSSREILKAAAIIAHQHHERWDGLGYPQGLEGKEIHIYGRITALADVFDALASERVYKKAWPMEEVFAFIRKERGKQFDPTLVDLLFDHMDELTTIHKANP